MTRTDHFRQKHRHHQMVSYQIQEGTRIKDCRKQWPLPTCQKESSHQPLFLQLPPPQKSMQVVAEVVVPPDQKEGNHLRTTGHPITRGTVLQAGKVVLVEEVQGEEPPENQSGCRAISMCKIQVACLLWVKMMTCPVRSLLREVSTKLSLQGR